MQNKKWRIRARSTIFIVSAIVEKFVNIFCFHNVIAVIILAKMSCWVDFLTLLLSWHVYFLHFGFGLGCFKKVINVEKGCAKNFAR